MRKLEEYLCSDKQCEKLIELGFEEEDTVSLCYEASFLTSREDGILRSQALDFFRDNGYIHITPCTTMGNYWFRLVKNYFVYRTEQFETYHEAESALIDKLIELEMEVQNGK